VGERLGEPPEHEPSPPKVIERDELAVLVRERERRRGRPYVGQRHLLFGGAGVFCSVAAGLQLPQPVPTVRTGQTRRMRSISRRMRSSPKSTRPYASQAFITTPIPHPTMGKTGQKNPEPVTVHRTTRNVLTRTYTSRWPRKSRCFLSCLIASSRS